MTAKPVKTATCHRCGAGIHLIPAGQHYKWVTNPANAQTWHCGNDPRHPVLAHGPAPGGRPSTDKMTVWRAPSGRLHRRKTCTGGTSQAKRVLVTDTEFAAAPRCRCIQSGWAADADRTKLDLHHARTGR